MRFLLDTHTLLWWFSNDPALSDAVREAIAMPENEPIVSSVCAWEIATKKRIGKLPHAGDLLTDFGALVRQARFSTLPISVDHALSAGALPWPHRDPFDRMLVAQGQIEDLPIATTDADISGYGITCIW